MLFLCRPGKEAEVAISLRPCKDGVPLHLSHSLVSHKLINLSRSGLLLFLSRFFLIF